jgi:DNA-binding FadR family transcriptional regulator
MARKHRDVMRILTSEIVAGTRPVGEMLPREVDLAEEFDVSRGVARETIRAMEERGLISVKHGKGATVNGAQHWDVFDPDVLAATLQASGAAMTGSSQGQRAACSFGSGQGTCGTCISD